MLGTENLGYTWLIWLLDLEVVYQSLAISPRRYQTVTLFQLLHYGCTQQEQFRLVQLVLVYSGFNIILAIKRIMQEARELANDPCTDYSAAPLEVGSFSIGLW